MAARKPRLTSMALKHFLAFEQAHIELAPLTVLLGANSTGKSAILHALVLLKQSLRGGDYRVPLTFGGPLLDMGRFQDVLWQQSRRLAFRLEWDNGQAVAFEVVSKRRVGLVVPRETFRLRLAGREYRLKDDDEAEPWYFSFELAGAPDSEKARAFREVNATIKEFFTALRYIGPLRQSARETSFSREMPESVGPDARYLIPFLIAHPDVTQRISDWLRGHRLADGLEVRETARGSGRWVVYLIEREIGKRRWNLADTGFGYSQLIPVLAELYAAPRGSLILIEQPELHLNPRLAVEVGDLLLDAVEEGKTVLVETHSEHLVLRLRRRIAEGRFPAHQLALYFARRSREEGKSYLERVSLDELGQPVQGWPEGFWGEDYEEAYHLTRAILERHR